MIMMDEKSLSVCVCVDSTIEQQMFAVKDALLQCISEIIYIFIGHLAG